MKKVLAVSLTALGDALMSLPALNALRRELPEARIGFLTRSAFRGLFENYPSCDWLMAVDGPEGKTFAGLEKAWEIFSTIRAFQPDTAVVFLGSPNYLVPLLRLAGVRRIVQVPNKHRFRRLLTNSSLSPDNDWDVREHAVEDRLRAVRLLGLEGRPEPITLPVQETWRYEARSWLDRAGREKGKVIVFQLCSSNFRRAWPKDRFARLAGDLLLAFPGSLCVITGAPHERQYCESVRELSGDERVKVSAGELSLPGLAGLLAEADLFVTPDTGTMHLGHAVRTPTVSLYGLYDLHRTVPLDKDRPHIEIQRLPPEWPNVKDEDRSNSGMKYIPYEAVYDACLKVLNGMDNWEGQNHCGRL